MGTTWHEEPYGEIWCENMDDGSLGTRLWFAILGRSGAMDFDNTKEAEQILRDGDPVDQEDTTGRTALWLACRYGMPKTCKLLLDHGADINKRGKTLKMPYIALAAGGGTWGCMEVVRMLVDKGADVNDADPDGMNALMSAVLCADQVLVKYLLERGANVHATFGRGLVEKGTTALDLCRNHRKHVLIELMLEKAAAAQPAPEPAFEKQPWGTLAALGKSPKDLI
mmetsp:Transcript_25923/g.64325  ORF Transcript_25923/g.64325 Transcript_25923/m.64325 type:complete len:225 (-) Transcript_25923:182-856(-)|eukprot:6026538-Prymnesium_polylepis.1